MAAGCWILIEKEAGDRCGDARWRGPPVVVHVVALPCLTRNVPTHVRKHVYRHAPWASSRRGGQREYRYVCADWGIDSPSAVPIWGWMQVIDAAMLDGAAYLSSFMWKLAAQHKWTDPPGEGHPSSACDAWV